MTRDALISCLMVCEAVLLLDLKLNKFPNVSDEKISSLPCKNLKWVDMESDIEFNFCFQNCHYLKRVLNEINFEAVRFCELTDIAGKPDGSRLLIIGAYGNPMCVLEFSKFQKCSLSCEGTLAVCKSQKPQKSIHITYRNGRETREIKKQIQHFIKPYELPNKNYEGIKTKATETRTHFIDEPISIDFKNYSLTTISNLNTSTAIDKDKSKSISIIIPSFMIIGMASIIVITVCCVLRQTKNDTSEKIFFSVKIQNLNPDNKFNVKFVLSKPVKELA